VTQQRIWRREISSLAEDVARLPKATRMLVDLRGGWRLDRRFHLRRVTVAGMEDSELWTWQVIKGTLAAVLRQPNLRREE
jgi:hypothetical protein